MLRATFRGSSSMFLGGFVRSFSRGTVRDAIKFSPHIIRGSIVKFCEKKGRERKREGHGL